MSAKSDDLQALLKKLSVMWFPESGLDVDFDYVIRDVNERDLELQTPLMKAARHPTCGPEDIRLLVDSGADINARGCEMDFYNTALHIAYHCDRQDIVETLIELGADQGVKDRCGRVPRFYLEWAKRSCDQVKI